MTIEKITNTKDYKIPYVRLSETIWGKNIRLLYGEICANISNRKIGRK